jgi:hypothetical protein
MTVNPPQGHSLRRTMGRTRSAEPCRPGVIRNPGLDVHPRQRLIGIPLVGSGSPQSADALQLLQRHGQGIGVIAHLVRIEPGAQFLVRLEPLTTTFDGGADGGCQCIRVVVGMPALKHQKLRIHAVGLPLHPHDLTDRVTVNGRVQEQKTTKTKAGLARWHCQTSRSPLC